MLHQHPIYRIPPSCSSMKRLAVLVDAAPVVSFSVEANAAVTAGYSVTVSGLNFGVDATTPTSTIGLSSCATASWASTSSVVCMLSMGEGVRHELRVTVSGVVGSRTSGFSYDGLHPSITSCFVILPLHPSDASLLPP